MARRPRLSGSWRVPRLLGPTVHDLAVEQRRAPYDHDAALRLAREHARDYGACGGQLSGGGLLCCAIDTELLGHWWYEGPAWLEAVFEEAEAGRPARDGVGGHQLVEPEERPLAASTWGRGKDFTTWDAPDVAELASRRAAELQTVAAVASHGAAHPALERAARELLAMQASDWPFMVTRDLTADYPAERMRGARDGPGRRAGRSDRLRDRPGTVAARSGASSRPLPADDPVGPTCAH